MCLELANGTVKDVFGTWLTVQLKMCLEVANSTVKTVKDVFGTS